MTESIVDFSQQITVLERRLRALRNNIDGTSSQGRDLKWEDEDAASLFTARVSYVKEEWDKFQSAWEEREMLSVAAGDDFPSSAWQDTQRRLREEIIQSEAILIKFKRQQTLNATVVQNRTADVTISGGGPSRAHLPKIHIPHFSGELLHWTHFRDTFNSMVHNEPQLSNVEKFHHLLGALKGEAASLISHINIEDSSYPLAWEALMNNYNNPRVLATFFIERILECNVKHQGSELLRYQRFLTDVADSVQSLRSLKLDDPFEFVLSTLALRTLGSDIREQFELSLDTSIKCPKIDDVTRFVRQRVTALKLSQRLTSFISNAPKMTVPRRNTNRNSRINQRPEFSGLHSNWVSTANPSARGDKHAQPRKGSSSCKGGKKDVRTSSVSKKRSCPFCQGEHLMCFCPKFLDTPIAKRLEFVSAWKGCHNCLREDHSLKNCPSTWLCRICSRPHHTLLHQTEECSFHGVKDDSSEIKPVGSTTLAGFSIGSLHNRHVILGTATAVLRTNKGDIPVRVLLDSGSQRTFIRKSLADQLDTSLRPFYGKIKGIGNCSPSTPNGVIDCTILSQNSSSRFETEAIVIDEVSSNLPSVIIQEAVVVKLSKHPLADQNFGRPAPIDVLIGNDIYPYVITGAPQHSGIQEVMLLPTVFGLVVSGRLQQETNQYSAGFSRDTHADIDARLKTFWEMEEPASLAHQDPSDEFCERHFVKTHTRDSHGRYVVQLPFVDSTQLLGDNRAVATKRFYALERKLGKDATLREKYIHFMREYQRLGHMSVAAEKSSYLIPHHGVWQNRPGGAKLRVVFDGSCPSSSQSLNDMLVSGPKLQADICKVLTRFRMYAVPLCADIVKMYRQVLVHPSHKVFQHILWRENPSQELSEYQLDTVTYGLKPSAFLAMRAIKQLCLDEGEAFPIAAGKLLTDMYVDDLVTGADSLEEAMQLREQLMALSAKGGFTWSKWASNRIELLGEGSEPDTPFTLKQEGTSETVKILGLVWCPAKDQFSFSVVPPNMQQITKRSILSAVARLFDPLGFAAPCTFLAKAIMQDIWKTGLDWDQSLPPELSSKWISLSDQWSHLRHVCIPRNTQSHQSNCNITGFCDASEKGYAAVVYLRCVGPNGKVTISLLKSKTRVAPTKYTSIPRLELCGALLLARTISSLDLPSNINATPACFTDSSIVLSWLRTPTHMLNVFEANRVAAILEIVPTAHWRHVRSSDNPADIASRGCLPRELIQTSLWWQGPEWLKQDVFVGFNVDPKPEARKEFDDQWMKRFSSFTILLRTVVRVLRFGRRSASGDSSMSGPITAQELEKARLCCIRMVQSDSLPLKEVAAAKKLSTELSKLSPFLDKTGILRVGGRLQNAPLKFSFKHPIILPRSSHLATLIADHIHYNHFHAGPTLTHSMILSQYWIPGGMKFVKGRILRCVRCRLIRAKPVQPLMAPLPPERLSSLRAFFNVGVDYAGPFLIKQSRRRNAPISKAYLCLFVCLTTKALHLEVVSDLTTTAFIAALDRFCARRGLPRYILSDHGSNFIGASRYIKELYLAISKGTGQITERLAAKGVEWRFIPPRAPNFGGIWEAGVKSVKGLLTATLGKHPLTFEELTTIFAKIESCLNSRPLCSLSEDPQSTDFLTPGHFLIGAPLTSLPDHLEEPKIGSNRTHWQTVQQLSNSVWRRWSRDYLHQLQQRTKWITRSPNLKQGELVILIEKRSQLGSWPVARITEVFPGNDGVVRVCKVRLPDGNSLIRASTSLAPLLFT